MKKERPKLELKKRTIANLSNIEMSHVYGGGGDDDDISHKACDQNDSDLEKDTKELNKKLLIFQSVLVC